MRNRVTLPHQPLEKRVTTGKRGLLGLGSGVGEPLAPEILEGLQTSFETHKVRGPRGHVTTEKMTVIRKKR